MLQIEIEPNAYVCESCQIYVGDKGKDAGGDSNSEIKLIIESGNVFHPNARLEILLPPNADTNSQIDAEGDTSSESSELTVRISSNNLFEEESHCIIDLRRVCASAIEMNTISETDMIHTAMGSYNQISAGAKVIFESIGNANIFHPKCDISSDLIIQNGNVFQACFYTNHASFTGTGTNNTGGVKYQEKILFMSGELESLPRIRNHTNGVKRNMMEVSLLLNMAKRIVQKHHRLMVVKS